MCPRPIFLLKIFPSSQNNQDNSRAATPRQLTNSTPPNMKLTKILALFANLIIIPTMATADVLPYMLPNNIPNGLYTVDLRETDRILNHISNHTINPDSNLHNTTNWLGGGSVARQNNKRWSMQLPDSTTHGCLKNKIDRGNYYEVRQVCFPFPRFLEA